MDSHYLSKNGHIQQHSTVNSLVVVNLYPRVSKGIQDILVRQVSMLECPLDC